MVAAFAGRALNRKQHVAAALAQVQAAIEESPDDMQTSPE